MASCKHRWELRSWRRQGGVADTLEVCTVCGESRFGTVQIAGTPWEQANRIAADNRDEREALGKIAATSKDTGRADTAASLADAWDRSFTPDGYPKDYTLSCGFIAGTCRSCLRIGGNQCAVCYAPEDGCPAPASWDDDAKGYTWCRYHNPIAVASNAALAATDDEPTDETPDVWGVQQHILGVWASIREASGGRIDPGVTDGGLPILAH